MERIGHLDVIPALFEQILNLLTIGDLTQTQLSSPQKSYNIKWEKLPDDFQLPDDPDATDLVTWLEQRQA